MTLASSGARQGHLKGFTLIELLVVIAIIGILSSVVLASLNTARNKGADAAIKSDIDSARAQAELYYDGNTNSYLGVCTTLSSQTPGGILTMKQAANSQNNGNTLCNDSATAWAMSGQLKTDTTKYWCTDSTGTSSQKSAALASATNC